jgi:hypothetical protein
LGEEGLARLALGFFLGVKGLGGVFSSRRSVASSLLRGFAMAVTRPYTEHLLPDNYLKEMGNVIAQWAFFEVDFDILLRVLASTPEAKKKLTGKIPLSFKKRVHLFRDAATLAFEHHPPTLKHHLDLAEKASRLRDIRDYVAHGRWIAQETGKGQRRRTTGVMIAELIQGNWENVKSKPISERGLAKAAREIGEMTAHIMALWRSVFVHHSIEPDVRSEIRKFQSNNFPKLPTPKISL